MVQKILKMMISWFNLKSNILSIVRYSIPSLLSYDFIIAIIRTQSSSFSSSPWFFPINRNKWTLAPGYRLQALEKSSFSPLFYFILMSPTQSDEIINVTRMPNQPRSWPSLWKSSEFHVLLDRRQKTIICSNIGMGHVQIPTIERLGIAGLLQWKNYAKLGYFRHIPSKSKSFVECFVHKFNLELDCIILFRHKADKWWISRVKGAERQSQTKTITGNAHHNNTLNSRLKFLSLSKQKNKCHPKLNYWGSNS